MYLYVPTGNIVTNILSNLQVLSLNRLLKIMEILLYDTSVISPPSSVITSRYKYPNFLKILHKKSLFIIVNVFWKSMIH